MDRVSAINLSVTIPHAIRPDRRNNGSVIVAKDATTIGEIVGR